MILVNNESVTLSPEYVYEAQLRELLTNGSGFLSLVHNGASIFTPVFFSMVCLFIPCSSYFNPVGSFTFFN